MGTLVFVCPATGLEVFTGLEMERDTFAALPSVLPDIRCLQNLIDSPRWPLG